jgi:hypothetical protein
MWGGGRPDSSTPCKAFVIARTILQAGFRGSSLIHASRHDAPATHQRIDAVLAAMSVFATELALN